MCVCVCALHLQYIQYFAYFISFLLCAFFYTHTGMCVHVCAHCADWAGVLAIRKTTSGKVHINHVPQLKERNGAEMGVGSGGGGEGGGERIMRDCV